MSSMRCQVLGQAISGRMGRTGEDVHNVCIENRHKLRGDGEMDKGALLQLSEIKKEIADLEERIRKDERKMEEYSNLVVSDTVTGTRPDGTFGPIKITGLDRKHYNRQKLLVHHKREMLKGLQEKLLQKEIEAEEYIQTIQDSRLRQILRYRYVDGLPWQQVARRMKGKCTADSCRMEAQKIFKTGSE